MFDNVNEVEFHETKYDKMLAVISQEGEKLEVCNAICICIIENNVELHVLLFM